MNTLCIGLIGEKGSGKGFFIELAKKLLPGKKIISIRFSDPLKEILEILDKEPSRENLQNIGSALRSIFHNEGILNDAIIKRLRAADADIVILDGIRKKEEITIVKENNGVVVYIQSDQRIRFERRTQMAEKPDEQGMMWKQFVEQDNASTESSIREIGETMTDVTIKNNGTAEEFEKLVSKFLKKNAR